MRRFLPRLPAALKLPVLAAVIALTAAAPVAAKQRFQDMTSGRYEVLLDGMLCHTCLRFIVDQVVMLKEVEKASGDFDKDTLYIVVRPEAKLKAAKLEKALRRAAKRDDLGTQFRIRSIRYRIE